MRAMSAEDIDMVDDLDDDEDLDMLSNADLRRIQSTRKRGPKKVRYSDFDDHSGNKKRQFKNK